MTWNDLSNAKSTSIQIRSTITFVDKKVSMILTGRFENSEQDIVRLSDFQKKSWTIGIDDFVKFLDISAFQNLEMKLKSDFRIFMIRASFSEVNISDNTSLGSLCF